jgi:parvulin-like peptidyl-prolyl isomerase
VRLRNLMLLLLVSSALAACGGAATEPAPPATEAIQSETQPTTVAMEPTEPPQGEAQTAPEDVVAVVNGQDISAAVFNEALATRRGQMNAVADEEALANAVLSELINQVLVEQAAADLGVTVTDEQLNAEVDALRAIAQENGRDWAAWLAENNYTEERLRDELRSQLISTGVRDVVVGDAAQENTPQVQARHILVDTREQAATIRARLIAGERFVDLAAEYSRDVTTRDQGGDLGWFAEGSLLEPVVAEVAFSQEPGTVSAPVATRLGWHIIETLAFDDLPLPPAKQAEVAQVVFNDWLTTLNDSAIIEINR